MSLCARLRAVDTILHSLVALVSVEFSHSFGVDTSFAVLLVDTWNKISKFRDFKSRTNDRKSERSFPKLFPNDIFPKISFAKIQPLSVSKKVKTGLRLD